MPSGTALSTKLYPGILLAPGRFSTTIFCPSRGPSRPASVRPSISTPAPGSAETITVMFLLGYCADADGIPANISAASQAADALDRYLLKDRANSAELMQNLGLKKQN